MPESASFSMRKKPNYRRRRTASILVLLVVVVVVVALLSRGGGGPGSKENPVPTLAFVSKVVSVAQNKAPDEATKKANGDVVVKMVTDYYQKAFVDPREWGDGQFEDLKALFAEAAQPAFTKDVTALTIGEARTQLKRVDPTGATLTVTVYYDAKNQPTLAVAAAAFNARGTLKDTGPAVTIKQKATFYMAKQGDGWIITDFDAEQTQDTPTPSPTPSAT
jgi:ketosteroid isomerase-like protein